MRPAQGVSDLAPYRAVVLGSYVRGANLAPDALDFVLEHREELAHLPVACFLLSHRLRNAGAPGNQKVVVACLERLKAGAPNWPAIHTWAAALRGQPGGIAMTPSPAITVRRATSSDVDHLTRLMLAYIVDFYKSPEPPLDKLQALIRLCAEGKEGAQFVAEVDGKLSGFATLMQWETAHDNTRAQRFYDRMGATRGDWLTYSI